jgi:hypothetical protein
MENITETVKSVPSESMGFLKYVFNFDDENKCEMLNMGQYAVLAIIPVLLVLKAVKHIIPEEDDSKGSLEIMAESIGQLLLIICAIWFTNKMIQYVPTYSGCEYGKFNATNFLLPFLIILATMQTKLGAKLNILLDRVVDRWEGRSYDQQQKGSDQSVVRVSQPLAGQHQPSQADYQDHNQILPSNPQLTSMPQMNQAPQQPQQISPQQSPDFNQMYQNQATPLQDANTPSMSQEPMAANDALGGMFGGSAW